MVQHRPTPMLLTDEAICAQNLNDHLADPSAVNAFNYATKFTPQ